MRNGQNLTITVKPLTPFASPLQGDTFFGQLCWAIRHRHGEEVLRKLLEGYTEGKPFMVLSDFFPGGALPKPTLPGRYLSSKQEEVDQKAIKRKIWLPKEGYRQDLQTWISHGCTDREVFRWQEGTHPQRAQPRNSINRLTGTTGKGDGFAPYRVSQTWYTTDSLLEATAILDTQRFSRPDLERVLTDMGMTGFGRDATAGLGKFALHAVEETPPIRQPNANAWLTLGACAPQGQGFQPTRSFYHLFTRFGRHGDKAALSGSPYKNPILMARAGAVISQEPFDTTQLFIGQGLGGNDTLSHTIPETIHQGYCPVVGIRVPWETEAIHAVATQRTATGEPYHAPSFS